MIPSAASSIRRSTAVAITFLITVASAAASAVPVWCGQALLLGTTDGAASSSLFDHPASVAADAFGNVYVADAGASTIRRIGPDGTVSTLAGQPMAPGSSDGTGVSAQFFQPEAISIGQDGTIYVADTGNDTIRKMTPSGSVTTWAGLAGSPGSADGPGSTALFNQPAGLAVDGAGNVYVADMASSTIRRIAADGTVGTLAGRTGAEGSADGPATAARFNHPRGLALDGSGNLYVADTGNNTIRRIARNGTVTTVAGRPGAAGSADGQAAAALFFGPSGVSVDGAGVLYVADRGNSAIRMISVSGTVSTYFTSATATDPNSILCDPSGVAVDRNGNVYFADTYNDVIRQASAIAAAGATFAASGPTSTGRTSSHGSDWPGIFTPGTTGNGGPVGWCDPFAAASGGFGSSPSTDGNYSSGFAKASSGRPASAGRGSRIVNLSALAVAGPGGEGLDIGFVIAGQGSKSILVRGVGPSLAQFGITGALSKPRLTLSGADGTITTAGAWGGSSSLSQTFAAVGAFALPANSLDAACVNMLGAGAYTAAISGASGSGLAVAEIYDADSTDTGPELVKISANAYIGPGNGALTAGFVIRGNSPVTLLIRGLGPALTRLGFSGGLPMPQLTLAVSTGQVLAIDSGWKGDPTLSRASNQVGALPLLADSNDTALLVTLPPGGYSAELSPVAGTGSGIGMIEIYEMP